MIHMKGVLGSPGYAVGTAVTKSCISLEPAKKKVDDTAAELLKFRAAQSRYADDMARLSRMGGPQSAGIFKAYQVLAADEAFFSAAFRRVESERVNMELALYEECESVVELFTHMDDPYMKERAADIQNVCHELIYLMLGMDMNFLFKTASIRDVILVADYLTPIEFVRAGPNLRGIVTEKGCVTSHTVLLANESGVPALIGVAGAASAVRDGDLLRLDADKGELVVDAVHNSMF